MDRTCLHGSDRLQPADIVILIGSKINIKHNIKVNEKELRFIRSSFGYI